MCLRLSYKKKNEKKRFFCIIKVTEEMSRIRLWTQYSEVQIPWTKCEIGAIFLHFLWNEIRADFRRNIFLPRFCENIFDQIFTFTKNFAKNLKIDSFFAKIFVKTARGRNDFSQKWKFSLWRNFAKCQNTQAFSFQHKHRLLKILPKATPSRAAITGMGSCSQAPMTALP